METSILFTLSQKKNFSLNKVKSKILSNLQLLQNCLNDNIKYEPLRVKIIKELHKNNDVLVKLKDNEYIMDIIENRIETIDEENENLSENNKIDNNTDEPISEYLEDIDENSTCLFDFCDD